MADLSHFKRGQIVGARTASANVKKKQKKTPIYLVLHRVLSRK